MYTHFWFISVFLYFGRTSQICYLSVAVQAVNTALVHVVCNPPTVGANTAAYMKVTVVLALIGRGQL